MPLRRESETGSHIEKSPLTFGNDGVGVREGLQDVKADDWSTSRTLGLGGKVISLVLDRRCMWRYRIQSCLTCSVSCHGLLSLQPPCDAQ